MAPGIVSDGQDKAHNSKSIHAPTPLKPTGVLEKFEYEEVTPIIGREFPTLNLVDDVLKAPNADDLLRELAITSEPSPKPPLSHQNPEN